MTITITLPGIDNKNTKDQIITVLVRNYPLTTRKIHNQIKKQFASSVSYQAVHKTLKELLNQGILIREERNYEINPSWVEKLGLFLKDIKISYKSSKGFDEIKKVEVKDNIKFLTFENLASFDKFLFEYEEEFHSKNKKKIVCWQAAHYYWPIAYSKTMFDVQKSKNSRKSSYKIFLNNTPLDIWAASYYKKLGVFVKIKEVVQSNYSIAVYGDEIMEIDISANIRQNLDNLFKKTKSFSDIDLTSFFKNLLEKPGVVKVKLQKSAFLAETVRSQILSIF